MALFDTFFSKSSIALVHDPCPSCDVESEGKVVKTISAVSQNAKGYVECQLMIRFPLWRVAELNLCYLESVLKSSIENEKNQRYSQTTESHVCCKICSFSRDS